MMKETEDKIKQEILIQFKHQVWENINAINRVGRLDWFSVAFGFALARISGFITAGGEDIAIDIASEIYLTHIPNWAEIKRQE